MKKEKLSLALEDISPVYIAQAALFSRSKKRGIYILRAVAAVLVLCVGLVFAADRFVSPDKQTVGPVILIEYGNAYYEIIDDRTVLDKYGVVDLPPEKAAGEHVAYLQKEVPGTESNYIVSEEETDTQLLAYLPAPYKAVMVLREGEEYRYALFCNCLVPVSESMSAVEALNVYGVYEAKDVCSITPVTTDNRWKTKGEAVLDEGQIELFFAEITSAQQYSFDEYHSLAFADELAEAEESGGGDIGSELYTQHADDLHRLMIETKDGLKFVIDYYPNYGWIKISAGMSYYKMSDSLYVWLKENID